MKMTMTNKEAMEHLNGLQIVMSKNIKFTRTASISIAKNCRKIADEIKEYLAACNELIIKYGTESNGDITLIGCSKDELLKYNAERIPLDDMNITVDIEKISKEDIPDFVEPGIVMELLFMMNE